MPVHFQPSNFSWAQVQEPQWTVDSWGLDKCVIVWRGPRPGKKAFEDRLGRFAQMPPADTRFRLIPGGPYPTMRLASWSSHNATAPFPSVEIEFLGFRSGTIPPYKAVDSNTAQTANAEGTDTATGKKVTGTVQYVASRTTYTWFTLGTPPISSPYNVVQNAQNPLGTIYGYRIEEQDTKKQINSISYSAFVAILNSLSTQAIVTNYEREPIVPNSIYSCRADVDFKLVS